MPHILPCRQRLGANIRQTSGKAGDTAGADADGLCLLVHLVSRVGAAFDRVADVVARLVFDLEQELARLEQGRAEVRRETVLPQDGLLSPEFRTRPRLGLARSLLLTLAFGGFGGGARLVRGGTRLLEAADEQPVEKLIAAEDAAIRKRVAVLEDDVRELVRSCRKEFLRDVRRKGDVGVLGNDAAGEVADESRDVLVPADGRDARRVGYGDEPGRGIGDEELRQIAVGPGTRTDRHERRIDRQVKRHEELVFGEALAEAVGFSVARQFRSLAHVKLRDAVQVDDGIPDVLRREERAEIAGVQVRSAAERATVQFEEEDEAPVERQVEPAARNRTQPRRFALRLLVEQAGRLARFGVRQGERTETRVAGNDPDEYPRLLQHQERPRGGEVLAEPAHAAGLVVEEHPERRMVEPVVARGLAPLRRPQERTGPLDFRLAASGPLPRQRVLARQRQLLGAEPVPFHVKGRPVLQLADGIGNGPSVVAAALDDQLHHLVGASPGQRPVFGIVLERPADGCGVRQRIRQRLEHAPHHRQVLGLDRRLDRIEGCRAPLVVGNPMFQPLCATVGFSVESQVVGYQKLGSDFSGYWQRGATFNLVGTADDEYDIQSIIPEVPEGAWNTDDDCEFVLPDCAFMIQTFDPYSSATEHIYYYLVGGEDSAVDEAGWYELDEDGNYDKAEITFLRGEGFLFVTPYVTDKAEEELGSSFTSSGEVKVEAKTLTNDFSGYWQRNNYRPVTLDIQKLIPTVSKDAWNIDDDCEFVLPDCAFMIQTFDPYSSATEHIYYYLVGGEDSAVDEAGWYELDEDSNYVKVTQILDPGEGFLFVTPYVTDKDEEEVETYLSYQE